MQTVKVLRENLIKKLSTLDQDNVSIADIVISRKLLLEALKLQTQPDADIINIKYGNLSWQQEHSEVSKTAIEFSCNHTSMRFFDCPTFKNWGEVTVATLNFVESLPDSKLAGPTVDTEALLNALLFVQHGVATDGMRPILECICLDCQADVIKVVSADGYRLPVATIPNKGIKPGKYLIYRKDATRLIKFLKTSRIKGKHGYWFDTYVSLTEKTIKFQTEKDAIELELKDGNFPNYPDLIPKDGTKVDVIADDLLRAVQAVSKVAKEGSGIVRLMVSKKTTPPDTITITGRDEELGDTTVDTDCIAGGDCKVAVNYSYLVALLKQCKGHKITLRVKQPSSPIVAEIPGDKLEVLMPMFVQW